MYAQPRQERIGAAIVAAGVTAALGWMLFIGLAGDRVRAVVDQQLAVFSVAPPPPPPAAVKPARRTSSRPSGRAAPPNLRSQATAVSAPRPVVIVPVPPPPIVVAVTPFAGDMTTQGAAPRAGPGTGAGGTGDGTGSGGWGDGDGGGMDETPPRWKKGRLRNADYPAAAGETGAEGVVSVKFLVWTDGRVRDCEVTKSSGSAALDDTTCRLIRQRFRYDPARDGDGRPVPAWLLENHDWVIERPSLPR